MDDFFNSLTQTGTLNHFVKVLQGPCKTKLASSKNFSHVPLEKTKNTFRTKKFFIEASPKIYGYLNCLIEILD